MRLSNKNKEDLFVACLQGNVVTVEEFLHKGVNVNLKCKGTGDTLLMTAVTYNKELVAKALLEHGANVNARNNDGNTALILASGKIYANAALVKMLLNNGADVNISNDYGATALIYAARYSNDDAIVEMLLNNGADVNMRDINGDTALMHASGFGTLGAVKNLLSHNANVNAKDNNGDTALTEASLMGELEVVKNLLSHNANVNMRNSNGRTALDYACRENNIDMVKVLLEYGAEIDGKDLDGKTALDYACENENIEIVRELIDNGASLNNISEENMQFITENLSDCSTIKILPAILNRDSENIGSYLGEYFNKISKDTSPNKMSVPEYMKDVSKFYQVNNYITNLKNSKEFKELREETKIFKEKIEKTNKVGSTSEKLDEIKQKVHRNKMILKELRTFEMNIKDILNVKILKPIYCKKQSIDFEIK